MYKRYERNNMLREKRKHANYKPNRRLDAKSSRGMIYENEELRLRTININAEVERGQSEIKSLKREREQLRREIWTLRDEYDKLENLLRTKGIDPDEFLNQNIDHGDEDDEGDDNHSECSECSCESCCGENCRDENASSDNQTTTTTTEKSDEASALKDNVTTTKSKVEIQFLATQNNVKTSADDQVKKNRTNMNFDHLSTVSEENSEVNSTTQIEDSIPITDLSTFLQKVDTLSTLNYLQTLNPPLSHFENLNYDEIGGTKVDNQGNILTLDGKQIVKKENTNQKTEIENQKNENQDTPSNVVKQQESPQSETPKKSTKLKFKHFFSPIRKKVPPQPVPSAPQQADVYVNAIANNLTVNQQQKPIEILQNEIELPTTSSPGSTFQTGGNLEELLFDLEAISRDIANLQCNQPTTSTTNYEQQQSESSMNSKKPFRSELNLFLAYPTPNDVIESSSPENTDGMPSLPEPMELINPLSHNNPLYLQNLPSPFPSPIPGSPLTPPMSFNNNNELPKFDILTTTSKLNFSPLNNSQHHMFSSNNSIFCTVSAPSTPASDRKCIEKFCLNDPLECQKVNADKKKAKRVSIVNTSKEDEEDRVENAEQQQSSSSKTEVKEGDVNFNGTNNSNHHSHIHRNHSHIHKRRASLDNAMNATRHKNHRQISNDGSDRVHRRESNRSYNSFKKRSRSDSAFGGHDDQGGTSVSERYSNSLASSRESSTSLSMKSGKRRISITSYESKKIPWCGCWGNSCI